MVAIGRREMVALGSVGFVVLQVVFLLQIRAEFGQVAFALVANLCFGFAVGHWLKGESRAVFALFGAAVGVALWVVIVVTALVFYQGAADYPVGAWFVRFGLAGALVLAGGAMFGDLAARKKVSVTTAGIASVVTIVGGIVAIIRG